MIRRSLKLILRKPYMVLTRYAKIPRLMRESAQLTKTREMDLKQAQQKLLRFRQPYKLHLGCGPVRLEGWVNIDLDAGFGTADILWDLSRGIPVEDASCELIYCEHLLEHLTAPEGVAFLRECRRALQSGGILRVAMPSLDVLIEKSARGDWKEQEWLRWPEYQSIQTRAEMLNIAFRSWGHQWLYDREELHRRLSEAGFTRMKDVTWGNSEQPELRNRETRADSLLICEAER